MTTDAEFNENLFVGKVGEFLFERVMIGDGCRVMPYGYESLLRGGVGDVKFDNGDDALAVRSSPDFLVLRDGVGGQPSTTRLYQIKTTTKRNKEHWMSKKAYERHTDNWGSAAIVLVCLPRRSMYVLGKPGRVTGSKVYWGDADVTPLSDKLYPDDTEAANSFQARVDAIFDVLGAVAVVETMSCAAE